MRIAIAGSGGVGKSTVAGTLARILARQGRRVLAVDLDPNPGLAYSLGLGLLPTDAGLPDEAVAEGPGGLYGWALAPGIDPGVAAERFALHGPDGVRYLSPGKIEEPDHPVKRCLAAVRQIVDATGDSDGSWDVVGDLEAGPTTPYEGYARFAEQVVLVVTPSWRSAATARHIGDLLPDQPRLVVGNRFGAEPDHDGLRADVRIPADPRLARAGRSGAAPLDACPDSPAVAVLSQLATGLLREDALL
jgi:CO dehydrogenase maturation factor